MEHDVIVIGSGAAGLTGALALAETRKVLVLAKGGLAEGSTAWAQGGIAAVLDERTIEITFRKDKVNAGQVLAAVQRDGFAIVDVRTREPDLEDVFLSLVSDKAA